VIIIIIIFIIQVIPVVYGDGGAAAAVCFKGNPLGSYKRSTATLSLPPLPSYRGRGNCRSNIAQPTLHRTIAK